MVLLPLQIVVVPLIEGVGKAFTVTEALVDAVHVAAFVTVTEYEVVVVGLTVIAAVVAVVLHKYEVPPLAVNVVLLPLQIVVVPLIDGVGD